MAVYGIKRAGDELCRARIKICDSSSRTLLISLCFLLIFSAELCLSSSSSSEKKVTGHDKSRRSLTRKSRFFNHARGSSSSSSTSSSSAQLAKASEDNNNIHGSSTPSDYDLFDEDKRLIHTGPNPLHN